MKKLLAILLALALCIPFCACGEKDDDEEDSPKKENRILTVGSQSSVEDYADFTLRKVYSTKKLTASVDSFMYYENENADDTYVVMVFDWTNTGEDDINCSDVVSISAIGANDKKHEKTMIAVETDNYSSLNTYGDIAPLDTVRLHCAVTVPETETELTLQLKVDGKIFTYHYVMGETASIAKTLNAGDAIEKADYATFTFRGISYGDKLSPSNGENSYSYYSVDDPSNTYLIVEYDITNQAEDQKSADSFLGVKASYLNKYNYTGFLVLENSEGTGFDGYYESIVPLSSRHCYYLIEVPKSVTENEVTVTLFFAGDEYIVKG